LSIGTVVCATLGKEVVLGMEVSFTLGETVLDPLGASVFKELGNEEGITLGASVFKELGADVGFTLGEDTLGASVFKGVGTEVGFTLGEVVATTVGFTLGEVVATTVGVDDTREKSHVSTREQALSLQVAEGLQQSELTLHPYFGSVPPPFFKPIQVEPTMVLSE